MPDLDNDNPTPDFDDLIAQAQRLREEGKYDKVIKLAVSISLEVLIKYKQFSSINEAVDTCKQILDTLDRIRPDEVVESPGKAYAMLAICASVFSENDPYHLSQKSMAKASEYRWTDFHTKSYWTYVQTPDAERDTEALENFRRMAQENPAAWFYVGEFEGLKKTCLEDARDAFLQVPENDPNYVRAMLRAGEYWELLAEDDEALYGFRYEAEDCYERALEKSKRSQGVRSAYLCNHFKLLLAEAAENGFDRGRVKQASEFVGKIYRVLSGKPAEAEPEAGRGDRNSAGPRLLAEQDMAFFAQIVQNLGTQIIGEVRTEGQQTRAEIRAGREDVQNLQDQLETHTSASSELIRQHVLDQLQLTDEKLADCVRSLSAEHSEFWGNLDPASVHFLSTGCYILDVLGRDARRIEYSCAAIEFAKALETELRKNLVDLLVSFAAERELGSNIFGRAGDEVTLGNLYHELEPLGLRTEFANSLEDRGQFLLTDFHLLKKIKKLRDDAAHGGNIGRNQATSLRNMVLEILPKIVAISAR